MTTQDTEMSETTLKDMLRSDLMEHRIKPKLYLPKFSGEIIHFQSFWESFTSAVHQNPDLSMIDKFNHSRACRRTCG